jgi:hypothetical protein
MFDKPKVSLFLRKELLPSHSALLYFSVHIVFYAFLSFRFMLLCLSANGFSFVQEVLVIRKIHPCLPSFKAEFTASVPLTRIRDIAHRGDIPHDLKVLYFAELELIFIVIR